MSRSVNTILETDKNYYRVFYKISKALFGDRKTVFFCILLSTLIILFGGYSYGTGDQIEQLPMILRYLNPSYCINDFFINASADFGPRFYYIRLLSSFGHFVPLPIVFIILTWLSNFGITLVTYRAAKKLADGSDLAAMIACCLIMGTPASTLGGILPLAQIELTPFSIACPFALASLWAGLRGRPSLSLILILIACPIHPQISLEVGCIALATVGFSKIIFRDKSVSLKQSIRSKQFVLTIICFLILCLTIAVFWLPREKIQKLEKSQFIQILAYFRHPHHFIPSTWMYSQYLLTAGFLLIFSLSWYSLYRHSLNDRIQSLRIIICVLIALLLWFGGYVFVELLPSRLWTMAQTFRLSFLINWMGFLVIAKALAYAIEARPQKLWRQSTSVLFKNAGEQCISCIGYSVNTSGRAMLTALLLMFFLTIGIVLVGNGTLWYSGYSLILPAVSIWLLFYLVLKQHTKTVVLILSCWLIAILASRFHSVLNVRSVAGKLVPAIMLNDTKDSTFNVAAYARQNTPTDAIFLTPPGFGRFRLTASRSIIVDFKAFPFQDWAILEWKQRMENCYGNVKSIGFPALDDMEEKYRYIDDEKILGLKNKYNISYAVLHSETETSFPILFFDDKYKIVSISTH